MSSYTYCWVVLGNQLSHSSMCKLRNLALQDMLLTGWSLSSGVVCWVPLSLQSSSVIFLSVSFLPSADLFLLEDGTWWGCKDSSFVGQSVLVVSPWAVLHTSSEVLMVPESRATSTFLLVNRILSRLFFRNTVNCCLKSNYCGLRNTATSL